MDLGSHIAGGGHIAVLMTVAERLRVNKHPSNEALVLGDGVI